MGGGEIIEARDLYDVFVFLCVSKRLHYLFRSRMVEHYRPAQPVGDAFPPG